MTESAVSLSKLRANVALAYRGEPRAVDLLLTALLARGHVLIEDVPGRRQDDARARARAQPRRSTSGASSSRATRCRPTSSGSRSSTPPSDRFEFHPGPIFANIVLADEINRATPKTQSALLEAMNEGAVTVESERRALPQPFMVVATQNPVEYLGTYPLPESQMDRFLLRLSLGYPAANEEKMLLRRGGTERVLAAIPAVLGPEQVLALQDETEKVTVSDALLDYLHALVRATRRHAGAAPAGLDARRPGALPLRPGPRPPAGPRLRDARRRAGGRRGRARAPHPVGVLGWIRGGRTGAGDRAEDPDAGGGAGMKGIAAGG